RVFLRHSDRPELRRPALLLVTLVAAQMSLGLGAYLWRFTQMSQAMSTTLGLTLQTTHRVAGAALLGTAVVLALRVVRLTHLTSASTERGPTLDRSLRTPLDTSDRRQVLA